jgi:hypothetical protein
MAVRAEHPKIFQAVIVPYAIAMVYLNGKRLISPFA